MSSNNSSSNVSAAGLQLTSQQHQSSQQSSFERGGTTVNATKADFTIEIALLGDTGVGKSSLLYRYSDGIFKSELIGTAGVDHKQKNIVHQSSQVRMTIWDTAGQVKFRPLAHTYYKGAAGIILVYDVTDLRSFENMGYWLQKIRQNAHPDSQIIMLGNKIDLINDIAVDQDQARQLADDNNIPYYQTSALDGKNLDGAFH